MKRIADMTEEERENTPDWVLGYVTAEGIVVARPTTYISSLHREEERVLGRPFRWSVWRQDYEPSRYADDLAFYPDEEDLLIIDKWLEENGHKEMLDVLPES